MSNTFVIRKTSTNGDTVFLSHHGTFCSDQSHDLWWYPSRDLAKVFWSREEADAMLARLKESGTAYGKTLAEVVP